MTEIDIRIAVQKEIGLRKTFSMIMIIAGILILFVNIGILFGLQYPFAILSIMLLMYFFVQNKKETDRLVTKYGAL
jgi:hypothetical protein